MYSTPRLKHVRFSKAICLQGAGFPERTSDANLNFYMHSFGLFAPVSTGPPRYRQLTQLYVPGTLPDAQISHLHISMNRTMHSGRPGHHGPIPRAHIHSTQHPLASICRDGSSSTSESDKWLPRKSRILPL